MKLETKKMAELHEVLVIQEHNLNLIIDGTLNDRDLDSLRFSTLNYLKQVVKWKETLLAEYNSRRLGG